MNARETKESLNEEQKAWVEAIVDAVDQYGDEFESVDEVLQWIDGADGEPETEWARENADFLLHVANSHVVPVTRLVSRYPYKVYGYQFGHVDDNEFATEHTYMQLDAHYELRESVTGETLAFLREVERVKAEANDRFGDKHDTGVECKYAIDRKLLTEIV